MAQMDEALAGATQAVAALVPRYVVYKGLKRACADENKRYREALAACEARAMAAMADAQVSIGLLPGTQIGGKPAYLRVRAANRTKPPTVPLLREALACFDERTSPEHDERPGQPAAKKRRTSKGDPGEAAAGDPAAVLARRILAHMRAHLLVPRMVAEVTSVKERGSAPGALPKEAAAAGFALLACRTDADDYAADLRREQRAYHVERSACTAKLCAVHALDPDLRRFPVRISVDDQEHTYELVLKHAVKPGRLTWKELDALVPRAVAEAFADALTGVARADWDFRAELEERIVRAAQAAVDAKTDTVPVLTLEHAGGGGDPLNLDFGSDDDDDAFGGGDAERPDA